MNRSSVFGLMLLALWATPASSAGATQPGERLEIVDRAIEHHGGDRYQRSVTAMNVCSRSGCYEIEARVVGGSFTYRASGEVSAGRRTVLVTNDDVRVWDGEGDDRVAAADEEVPMRDWVMQRIYFPFLPYRLNDPSVYKTDQGLERWGDRELHRVKVTFEPGSSSDASDEYLYWFDPESGRVEQFAYSYKGSPGGLRFRTGFNYRRVGGILFFDQQNLGAEGDGLSVDLIDPDYVRTMRRVSTVELSAIRVESVP